MAETQAPRPVADPRVLRRPEGAVRLDDPCYLRREADHDVDTLAPDIGNTLVIKAPRQMGKTSLLIRYLAKCKEAGKHTVLVDFQLFTSSQLEDLQTTLSMLAPCFSVTWASTRLSGALLLTRKTDRDAEVVDESFKNAGAVVMGRRMFDLGRKYWGDNPPFHMPVFVLTHNAKETLVKEGGTTFTFVTDGIESALSQAKASAGGKDVSVAGGANTVQQFIKAGLLDEVQIHLVPVLFGEGRRLFDRIGAEQIELELTRSIESPGVTHLRFRIAK